jgi:hypothetical protein
MPTLFASTPDLKVEESWGAVEVTTSKEAGEQDHLLVNVEGEQEERH